MLQIKMLYREMRQSLLSRKRLWGALSLSVINQILTSGTNFVLGIYLLRTLSPEQFGLYGIGFASILFFFGIGHFAFLTPMVVHFHEKTPETRLYYTASLFAILLILSWAALVTTAIGSWLLSVVHPFILQYINYAAAIAFSSVAYIIKEFYIRYIYNIGRETLAIRVHGVIALITFMLLLTKEIVGGNFAADQALWIYGAAQIAGVIVAYKIAPLNISCVTRIGLVEEFQKMWAECKWGSIVGVIFFIRAQSHMIIVTALIGPIGVAKLNASRMLITPMAMLTPALSQIALPRLSAVRVHGDDRVRKAGYLIATCLLILTIAYSVLLLTTYDLISSYLLGVMYGDIFTITMFWCFYLCVASFRNGIEMSAQALCKLKNLSKNNAVSAVVGLTSTYWLTSYYGLFGSLIGLSIAEIMMIVLLYYSLQSADVESKSKGLR